MQQMLPPELTLSPLPLPWKGELRLCLSLYAGFSLAQPELIPAPAALAAAAGLLAPGEILDSGVPKKCGEWLLAGSAHAPGGKAVPGLIVEAGVGDLKRALLVSGDRFAGGGGTGTEARPFTAMPLDWAHAAGGPDSPDNPLGRGAQADPATGLIALPNVTDKNAGPALPGELPSPACFRPVGAWPCRLKNMGTYDRNWLTARWPGVPDDFDWTFYNLAQPVQRLSGFFSGLEPVRLVNLHPQKSLQEGRLPGKRLRLFARNGPGSDAGEPGWRELSAALDTVWLFPEAELGLLIWHASCPAADESASNIPAVAAVFEDAEQPPAEAGSVLRAALAPPSSPSSAPPVPAGPAGLSAPPERPGPLAPGTVAAGGAAVAAELREAAAPEAVKATSAAITPPLADTFLADARASLAENMGEINAVLAEHGLPPVNPADVDPYLQANANLLARLEQEAAKPGPELEDLLAKAGVSTGTIEAVRATLDMIPPDPAAFSDQGGWAAAVEAHVQRLAGPLSMRPEHVASIRDSLLLLGPQPPQFDELGTVANALKNNPPSPVMAQMLAMGPDTPSEEALRRMLGAAGLDSATAGRIASALELEPPLPEAFPTPEAYRSALLAHGGRVEAMAGFPAGSLTSRLDAAQANFLKLVDADPAHSAVFRTEWAAAAEAAEARKAAVRAGQVVTGAGAEAGAAAGIVGAVAGVATGSAPSGQSANPLLTREDVERALAENTPLAGRNLTGADAAGLDLSGLDFSGRDLAGTVFDKGSLAGANLAGAKLDQASFGGVDLRGANMARCSAHAADFSKAALDGAVCSGLAANGADFSGASLPDADLRKAELEDAVFDGAILAGASLTGAGAAGASFEGTRAPGCDFEEAGLDRAIFTAAELADSKWGNASLRKAVFQGCDLARADFSGSDLCGSLLMAGTNACGGRFGNADLSGCFWENSAARQADFRGVKAPDASFENCDLEGSDWSRVSARKAVFARSSLRGANLERLDLMGGSLREARLGGAKLCRANLVDADLYRAATDGGTDFAKADAANTCLEVRL